LYALILLLPNTFNLYLSLLTLFSLQFGIPAALVLYYGILAPLAQRSVFGIIRSFIPFAGQVVFVHLSHNYICKGLAGYTAGFVFRVTASSGLQHQTFVSRIWLSFWLTEMWV
jgi:hypothetical protein